jgi:hypothetical protein
VSKLASRLILLALLCPAGHVFCQDMNPPIYSEVGSVNENDATVSVCTINSNRTLSAVGVAIAGNSPFAVAVTAASH